MPIMDNLLMTSKFRGCLLGALLGDCLGSPFEGDSFVAKVVLQQYFDKLDGPYVKAPVKQYTDDTAMMKSVVNCLIHTRSINAQDLAKRFVQEYNKDPRRGYGQNVTQTFRKLESQKCADPFGPAKEQFDGSGSLGNGAAMRVAPVALFYRNSLDDLIANAKTSALITHTNKLGYNGAILQALAVQQSLMADSATDLDVREFSTSLIEKMKPIESEDAFIEREDPHPYVTQLKHVQSLLDRNDVIEDEIQDVLGNSIAALYSVPTAIYCFLKAQSTIPCIKTHNPFRRTIQYAISLGGDTDTIASMAGAIAGAYYGQELIGESLQKHCEGSEDIIKLADELCNIAK